MYSAQFTITRIQDRIKEKGFTQKQVLANCGLNENTLIRMTDKKGMSSFGLAMIADTLNCSVDYLLGRTNTPEIGGVHQEITAGRDNYVSSTINNGFSKDDIDLLHLIQEIPVIERSKLIIELSKKYNAEK